MKKSILALMGLLMFATSGSALASYDGKAEAYRFCDSLNFPTYASNCRGVVNASTHFDTYAISSGCERLSFDSSKYDCIRGIANKGYYPSEVDACAAERFDSRIVDCLTRSGRPTAPPYPYPPGPPGYPSCNADEVSRDVRHALSSLRQRNYALTERILNDLLVRLSRP